MKREQNKNIDFDKFVDSDCIDMATDVIKGVHNILNSLELSHDAGKHPYDKYSFYALQIALEHGINEIEALKPGIEYMGDFMRYETITEKEVLSKWNS